MTATERNYRPMFWLVLALVFGWLTWLLSPILTPFAISALLAYLGDPLVDKLQETGRSRTTGVLVVFLLISLILFFALLIVVPMLGRQISSAIENLPLLLDWVQSDALPWIAEKLRLDLSRIDSQSVIDALRDNWEQAGGIAAQVLGGISRGSAWVFNWAMNLLLIPVVTFYLLRDWDEMMDNIRSLLPRSSAGTVTTLASESNQVLAAFLRGQLLVMLVLGTVYTVGLWLVGINYALLIGMGAGLVSFVPYLGTVVGVVAGLIAALVQYGDVTTMVLVGVVFLVGQLLEGMWLTPNLVGDRIGLHPVAVIFAVLAFGQLFGFLGVLIALPLASVVMVLLRHATEIYRLSSLYEEKQRRKAEESPPVPDDAEAKAVKPKKKRKSRAKKTTAPKNMPEHPSD